MEETIKRVQSHKGVLGVVVVNNAGIPIKTTLDNDQTAKYSGLLSQLTAKARSVVRELDTTVCDLWKFRSFRFIFSSD